MSLQILQSIILTRWTHRYVEWSGFSWEAK